MDVAIKDCPACGAAVLGDSTHCMACGKPLAADAPKTVVPTGGVLRDMTEAAATEQPCPRCGSTMPKFVIRCRDCGAFMDPAVEAAQRAKKSSLVHGRTWTRGIEAAGGAAVSEPSAAPLPDATESSDDDFEFSSDVPLVEEAPLADAAVGESSFEAGEDDFEFDGVVTEEYSIADAPQEILEDPNAPVEQTYEAEPTEALAEEIAEPVGEAAPAAEAEATSPEQPAGTASAAHSEATGGDALLAVAMAEEAEAAKRQTLGAGRRRLRKPGTATGETFVIYCPNGHRVQVQEKHRGKTGRCPNCKAPFFVPGAPKTAAPAAEASEGTESGTVAPTASNTGYERWILDVKLHRVNPLKLKLKPDSLVAEYDTADIGLAKDHLLLAAVFSGGGAFRGMSEPKKKPVTRQAMLEFLAEGHGLEGIPVDRHAQLTAEQAPQWKLVQPVPPGEESLFADVPVFGVGRIAVRIPSASEGNERWYVSFSLSQFREFSRMLSEIFQIADFGAAAGIPLTDNMSEATCHYSEAKLRYLPDDKLPYYRADTALTLDVIGWKCQGCGIVVSEDSRKKEKIGSKSPGKSLCPKCKRKFGDQPLHAVKATEGA